MELVAAEKHQQEALKLAQERNKTLSMLDEILEDVRRAADRLEEEIEDHVFDNNKQVRVSSVLYPIKDIPLGWFLLLLSKLKIVFFAWSLLLFLF